ncbi:MAG: hypothetical protein CMF72_15805 [Mameliella sp.]|nr:hypothetical protein [Mameliella sp.]
MTTVTESHIPQTSLIGSLFRFLTETVGAFSRARSAAAEFEFLTSLSDEELTDRGLDRDMIVDRVNQRFLGR